jgi:diaminohydroxyphosphoribosylaminopyrimidine deaminase/5-amino-6-(5-phosphoribosylamino)uracil reductase
MDKYFMKMALALAIKGQGFVSPNPMVGAVIVKDGKVVGKGYHKAAGEAHAEINAINDAQTLARGATLYVTLEPCNHTGRTPPCTVKVVEAGIRHVIIAMSDPNPDVAGGGADYIKKHGINVSIGVCENEAKRLNEAYIKYITIRRPFVIIKCAATESRIYVHRLRHSVDAIMVGINTVKQDDPALTVRLNDMNGLDPARIILDTNLTICKEAKVLRLNSNSDTIIISGNSVSEDKKVAIEALGAKVIQSPVKDGMIDLEQLMDRLGGLGITSLLIEGGGSVIASALKAGIVDKVIFFYAPKISGGDDGMPICKGPGPALMDGCIPVKDIHVRRFGDDVMIEGYVKD